MDFFEAQVRARRRSGRLVVLFALAVLGTCLALYFAFVAGTSWLGLRATATGGSLENYQIPAPGIDWWQPGALKTVAFLLIPTVVFSALYKWRQLRAGGTAVAELVGGRRLASDTTSLRERTLLNVVEEMALASGLPMPAVYILPAEPAINAFAAGHAPADAAIAVSAGALERLDRDELQGVVAHEFSHILYGDMRLNTRLIALLYGILSLVIIGRSLLRAALEIFRHSGGSRKKNGAGIALPFGTLGGALFLIGGCGYLFGRLIQSAVSREREYLADAAATQFTRHPAGLAGALKKVGSHAFAGRLTAPSAGEVSHCCFCQNFRTDFGGFFATHPPLPDRIRRLDPAFDGKFPTSAPDSPLPLHRPASAPPPPTIGYSSLGVGHSASSASALISSAGLLHYDSVTAARAFLETLPDPLRTATRDPSTAPALACALCLPANLEPSPLETAAALVATHAGNATAERTLTLYESLAAQPASARLPLLRLTAPALRSLPPPALDTLLATLDALVHADGTVTPYEFALQKILTRELNLASQPRSVGPTLSPAQVSPDLSLALSCAARIDTPDDTTALQAFTRAAAEFGGLHPPLAFQTAERSTLGHLDRALDRLALTPAPFRKRILHALAAAVTADATLAPVEADLLRAIAAALDCPIPPNLSPAL